MNNISRQCFLGENCDEIYETSIIAIIGLCGGGSHIAQQLAHIGFKNFILLDPDIVEESNLHRMIGSCRQDAVDEAYKTVVIDRLIKKIQPDANIKQVIGEWQENHELLRACDAIVGCVDSYSVRDELERYGRRYLLPYIDIGMDVHEMHNGYSITGQIITSLPNSPCMRCLGYITERKLSEEQMNYGATGGKPQVVWPNGVLASIAVGQLVSILTPWNSDMKLAAMIEYDGNRQTITHSQKLRILEKHRCGHFNNKGGSLGDPFFSSKKLLSN